MSRPAQIAFLSRWARAYDPVAGVMGFPRLWRAIADVAAPHLGERALDVCAGTGGVAGELARRGARVVGVDLAYGMLRHARRKQRRARAANLLWLRMDARQLAFRTGAFPLVTCSMALHEMAEAERRRVLREVARVGSDRVVVAEYRVPRSKPWQWLFRFYRVFEYAESDDFEQFVRRDFRARLEGAGLRIRSVHDLGGYRIWACTVSAT